MYFSIKLCRLCISDSDTSLTLMNLDSDNITFIDKLNTILPEIVDINSELPNTICTSCITKLNEAYMFIKSCLKSQEELKQTLKQLQSKEVAEMSDDRLEIKMEDVSNDEADPQIDYETDICFVNVPVKKEIDFLEEENSEHSDELSEYCLEKFNKYMNCEKANGEKQQKTKKLTRITMERKKEIVQKYEGGMRIRDLTIAYRIPRTTISTIVKNKDIIKSANVAKGVKSISKQRSETLDQVEKLLLHWITEKQQCAGDSVSEPIICAKAKKMHADLMKNQAGTSQENEVFKASHGWFMNFKKRAGIHNVVRHGKVKNFEWDPSSSIE